VLLLVISAVTKQKQDAHLLHRNCTQCFISIRNVDMCNK